VSDNLDVVVLGAGISGLCLAHHVARAGRKVLVLESAAQPGGCFRSERQPADFWFEMGAHTLYNSYGSLLSIIDELGLRDRMLTRQKAPFRMLVDGKLRSIPWRLSLPELFASAWHAFSERKQGRTVADYYGRLVGRRNWKRVVAPLFATVFSQPADKFPAEMLFKKRTRRKDIPRSYTFAGGVQTLTDRIAAEPGITVRTNAQVHALAREDGGFVVEIAGGDRVVARRLALALPAPVAANLLASLAPEIATALSSIQTAKIESVGVVAEARHVHLPRLAGIVPVDDTFFSVVTRDVVPDERLRAFTFHFRAGLTLDHRIDRICAVTGLGRDQLDCVATHSTSLPSLSLGHAGIAKEIDRHLPASGIYITGNYFGGLAIEDCSLRSAKEAARLLAEAV
jgi:protoporphyrinogen oxidase